MANIEWSNTLEDFPKFLSLEQSEIKTMIEKTIHRLLQNIITVLGIEDQPEISVDYDIMSEIITRVEKRRVYFHIYYGGVNMGELNEASLVCFWILKLMPFRHATISNTTLNAKIAYTFFLNVLFYVAAKTGKKVNARKPVLDQLLYAFKFRDLSKEAIMALAESLLYWIKNVKVRDSLDLTQREFAKNIYVSQTYYSNVENGNKKINDRIIALICSQYGVRKEYLLNGVEPAFSENLPDIQLQQLLEIFNELEKPFQEYTPLI